MSESLPSCAISFPSAARLRSEAYPNISMKIMRIFNRGHEERSIPLGRFPFPRLHDRALESKEGFNMRLFSLGNFVQEVLIGKIDDPLVHLR